MARRVDGQLALIPTRWDERGRRTAELGEAWAGRYVNETDAEPTDVEMARVFAPCSGNCPPVLYPAIREAIYAWRRENGRTSRLRDAEVVDG